MYKKRLMYAFILTFLLSIFPIESKVNAEYINVTDISLKRCLNLNLGLGDVTSDITIDQMKSLTDLVCNEMGIEDISSISYASNLKLLSMYGNNISDISPLSSLTNLNSLTLHKNNISNISSIKNLSKLELLHFDDNMIEDISPIANLTSLKYLYLANNRITDVSSLSKLTRLVELFLQNNNISDISSFTRLTSLRWVSIDNNSVSDISSFQNISNLNGLYAANNKISDISPLKGKYNLYELYVQKNKIGDISPIKGLRKIYAIGLDNQNVDTAPVYSSDDLETYPNIKNSVKLENSTLLEVSQAYNTANKQYSGSFSKSAYKGLTTFSGTLNTKVLPPNPSEDAYINSNLFTTDVRYAPKTQEEILKVLNVRAFDPLTSQDVTNSVNIVNSDNYNFQSPQVGEYNFIFSIKGSSGKLVYYSEKLVVKPATDNNLFVVTTKVIGDEDGDLLLNKSEVIEYEVLITNNNGIDLIDPVLTYNINESYLKSGSITNVNSGSIPNQVNNGNIVLTPKKLGDKEVLKFTFKVTANDTWYINDIEENLSSFNNKVNATIGVESYDYNTKTNLIDSAFTSISNTFTLSDESENDLLTTSEKVSLEYEITNKSLYNISKFKIGFNELSTHLIHNIENLEITSDKRTLVVDVDYSIVNSSAINVYEVLPDEKLSVVFNLKGKKTFSNTKDLSINSNVDIYSKDLKLLFNKSISDTMPVDTLDAYNVSFTSLVTDENNDLVLNGESVIIKFEIKNSGTIDALNAKVKLNLDDLNIKEKSLTTSMVNLNVLASTTESLTKVISNVSDNTINIPRIAANQTINGEITVTANDTIDVSEFKDNLSAIAIEDEIKYSDNILSEVKKLSLPVDYNSLASLESSIKSVEVTGDSDLLIDSNETWKFEVKLTNNGKINLDKLQLLLDVNDNSGVKVDSIDVKVFNKEVQLSNVSYENSVLSIDSFKVSDELTAVITVKYNQELSNKLSTNLFTISHPYISEVKFEENLGVDLVGNQKLTISTTQSIDSIKRGETVSYVSTIKNEGKTNEKQIAFVYNFDKFNIEGDKLLNITLNDGKLVENQDYFVLDNKIVINKLLIDEQVIVKFSVKSKDSFTISPSLGEEYIFNNSTSVESLTGTVVTNNHSLTPDFGVVDYSLSATLKGIDNSDLVGVDEEVFLTVNLDNGSALNLTNNVISFDVSDLDVDSINSIEASSTNSDFSYSIVDNKVLIDNISVNEKVSIKVSLTTSSSFDSSKNIDVTTSYVSDLVTKDEKSSITKKVNPSVLSTSKLISTSSGNLLMGSDEFITYKLTLKNDGDVNLDSLSVTTDLNNVNFDSQSLVSVKDESNNDLSSKVTYSQNKLTVNGFNVSDTVIIEYKIKTASSIVFEDSMSIDNTIVSGTYSLVDKLPISIDLSGVSTLEVSTDYNIPSGNESLSPSDNYNSIITIENQDDVSVSNVYINDLTSDVNVASSYSNLVLKDGNGNTLALDTDYFVSEKQIHLPLVNGNAKIIISYSNKMSDTFRNNDYAKFKVGVKANYPGIGIEEIIYESNVLLNIEDNLEYSYTITSDATSAKPSDEISFAVNIKNTGKVDLESLVLLPVFDSNLNYSTLKVDVDDQDKASVKNGIITINSLNASKEDTINFKISANSIFNANKDINIKYKNLSNSATCTIAIDRSSAVLTNSLVLSEETGDMDSLVDNSEVIKALLTVKNNSNFSINNVEVSNIGSSSLVKSISNLHPFSLNEDGNITITSIPAHSQVVISYNLNIDDYLSSNLVLNEDLQISYDSINTNAKSSLNVDVLEMTSVSSTYEVNDASGNDLAEADELLTYSYSITNDGFRNLDNSILKIDHLDINLANNLTIVSYKINGVDKPYSFNTSTSEFLVSTLKPNDKLDIVYTISTKSELQKPVLRFLNVNVVNNISFKDSNMTVDDTMSAKIKLSNDVVKLKSTSSITDSDEDGFLKPGDKFVFELKLENTGNFVLDNVKASHVMFGENYLPNYDLVVKTGDGTELEEDVDYSKTNGVIVFKTIDPGDKIVVSAEFDSKSVFNLDSQTIIETIITNENISTQKLFAKIPNDYNTRDIETSLTVEDSSVFSASKVGDKYYYKFTLTNKGKSVEENVVLSHELDNKLVTYVAKDYTLLINGVDYSNEILSKDDKLVLPVLESGDVIVVEYGAYINENLVNLTPMETMMDIVANANVTLSDSTLYTTSYSNSISKSTLNDIDVSGEIEEVTLANNLANPNESIKGTINIKVSGHLEQKDVSTTINIDSLNANSDTFEIESVDKRDGAKLTKQNYSVDGNKVILSNVKYLDEYQIKYSYNVKPTIQYSTLVDGNIVLEDSYSVDVNYGPDSVETSQMLVDNAVSSLQYETTINDVRGNGDGLAQSGELLTSVNKITNNGKVVEKNVILKSNTIDENVDLSNIEELYVKRNGVNLAYGIDYSVNLSTLEVTVFTVNPTDEIVLEFDVRVEEELQDAQFIEGSGIVKSGLGETYESSTDFPIDVVSASNIEITESFVDGNDLIVTNGEELEYTTTFTNNGNINYNLIHIDLDFSTAQLDVDDVSITIEGSDPSNVEYSLFTQFLFYDFKINDFKIGDTYTIKIKYKPLSVDDFATLNVKSMYETNALTTSDVQSLKTEFYDEITDITKDDPYITGDSYATTPEGTVIDNLKLMSLFNIDANDHSGKTMEIIHDINTNVAGEYEVKFVLTDELTNKHAEFTAKLLVTDVYPTITGDSVVVVKKGVSINDYVSLFNVEATEIDNGDLNSLIMVDSSLVNINAVGEYYVTFSVKDSENNQATLTSKVIVKDTIVKTGVKDYLVFVFMLLLLLLVIKRFVRK